jgi:MbtH protein
MGDNEDKTIYKVVLNEEEQYSIWRSDRPVPAGWKEEGTTGPKATCLERVESLWTDMRPLSLRKKMDAQKSSQQAVNGDLP